MTEMNLHRAEGLQEIIDDMNESGIPVIVEGERDRKALKRIGITLEILVYNTGHSMSDFCDMVAERYRKVIILTDWDRSGIKLHDDMKAILSSLGVEVDDSYWRELDRFTGRAIKEVEVLDTFYLDLIGGKGQDPLDRFKI